MKIWNTKYCLTQGITEHHVDDTIAGQTLVAVTRSSNSSTIYLYKEGGDWHKSIKAAIARAEELKIKKLKSLNKQLKIISEITFES